MGNARVRRHAAGVAGIVAVAGLLAGGCGTHSAAASPDATRVDVRLHDFAIQLSRPRIPAGKVAFVVQNVGPSTHEFKIVRTNLAADALPMQPGGLSVNDDSAALHSVRDIDEVDAGDHTQLEVDLAPGHYVVYCNFEGHYLGGTRAAFDVVARGGR
jgi:uncharacterized cupredoxin-like copper-binding protein